MLAALEVIKKNLVLTALAVIWKTLALAPLAVIKKIGTRSTRHHLKTLALAPLTVEKNLRSLRSQSLQKFGACFFITASEASLEFSNDSDKSKRRFDSEWSERLIYN